MPVRRPRRGDVQGPEAGPDHRADHLRRRQRRRRQARLGVARPGISARKDASGRLYKPLFAFMVIGLNGRIPLNTAGNLAAQVAGGLHAAECRDARNGRDRRRHRRRYYSGPGHALHLGNSVSEVDPTYALQNAFDPTTSDPVAAFSAPRSRGAMVPPYGGVLYPSHQRHGGVTYSRRIRRSTTRASTSG